MSAFWIILHYYGIMSAEYERKEIFLMSNPYQNITNYLHFLSRRYNVKINIKDFFGFIPINKELDEALRPFLAHTNPFCMYIKSETQSYHTCLRMIRKMYSKFENGDYEYFFWVCHAGLMEYVIPIRYEQDLLGSINAGFFQSDPETTQARIRSACLGSRLLQFETAYRLYEQYITAPDIAIEDLLPQLNLLAEYLSHTYGILCKTHPTSTNIFRYHNSNEDMILSHAVKYIQQNSSQRITVNELADFCHCSTSYLSRIFKKRTSVNINTYINKVRIELSKNHLMNSTNSIAEIAITTGFDDPNYYSRVFTKMIGISPTEFRRRFKTFT